MVDNSCVCLVIVLYYPEYQNIKSILEIIRAQNIYVVFIDNTPDKNNENLETICKFHHRLVYKALRINKGIAEAQNIGILEARKINEVEFILFLDQDSALQKDFVKKMLSQYKEIENNGHTIAALGPVLINIQTSRKYKQNIPIERHSCGYYKTSALISSGMIARLNNFKNVGLMESELFIDAVDFEWCWRAKLKGYSCFITEKVEMLHKVGEMEKSFLGHRFIISSPIRYFYQYRNFVLLSVRSYVPIKWKIKGFLKKLFLFIYVALFSSYRLKSVRFMINGSISGLKTIFWKRNAVNIEFRQ